jgi:type IX secretion system PorP/SprF family membrane protein
MRRIIILLFCWSSTTGALAQQVPGVYHYYLYPALINPAATGMEDYSQIISLYKNQWIGMPDAPQTQVLMVTTPIKQDKLGLGFTFYNDQVHVFGNTGAYASASYRLTIAENHRLNFGLSMGAYNSRIFFDRIRVEDPFESTLLNNAQNAVNADVNAGILYQSRRFQLGVASAHLLKNNFNYQNEQENKSLVYKLVRHYNLMVGYKMPLDHNFEIQPTVLLRSAQGLPAQIEANTTLAYQGKCWINLAYRHQSSAGVALGFLIADKLVVSYNYDYALSSINRIASASHEFSISYRLVTAKNSATKIPGLDKLQRDNQEQYEMLDQLEQKTDTLKLRIDQHEQEIKLIEEVLKNEKKDSDRLKKDEEVSVSVMDKLYDYYLVVGSFNFVQNAKLFQEILKRKYNLDTRIALSRPVEEKRHFLVYTKVLRGSKDAKEEIKKLKQMDRNKKILNQDPWLYRVQ